MTEREEIDMLRREIASLRERLDRVETAGLFKMPPSVYGPNPFPQQPPTQNPPHWPITICAQPAPFTPQTMGMLPEHLWTR